MSKLSDLQALYGAPPPPSSDYESKPSKKRKRRAGDAPKIKSVPGFKIVDYDAETRVRSAVKEDESDEGEDAPNLEVDAELQAQADYESKLQKARERSSWVTVAGNDENDENDDYKEQDLSPPRKKARVDGDLSPPRHRRDLSPPRRQHGGGDLSPPRKRSSGSDLSPPRRGNDLSPPRRGRVSDPNDLSPPRRRHSEDLSPPRRGHTDDLSPPRVSKNDDLSPPRRSANATIKVEPSKMVGTGSMISGERAGLYSGSEIAEENATFKKKQMDEVKSMNPSAAGKDAQTIYRDKRGRPLAMLNQMVNQDKGNFVDETADMEWGVGKVDRSAKQRQEEQDEAEKGRGYHGQTVDDARYNERMRERERWNDPMAKFLSKGKKKSEKKEYKGYAPANRFSIRPGHRWDGVDRSNGFEAELFRLMNEAKSMQEVSYKMAAADM